MTIAYVLRRDDIGEGASDMADIDDLGIMDKLRKIQNKQL